MPIDPASSLGRAIFAALRANEIGDGDPYRLSFAGLGQSGPSFGIFQADVAQNEAARATLLHILIAAGIPGPSVIISVLARPLQSNPLEQDVQQAVAAAMASNMGRAAIDALDQVTFSRVLAQTQTAIDAAAAAGVTLDDGAACMVALWANMSGAPTTLDRWLGGEAVELGGVALQPPAGPVVRQADIEGYLEHTAFFTQHPRNLVHLRTSVATGLAA